MTVWTFMGLAVAVLLIGASALAVWYYRSHHDRIVFADKKKELEAQQATGELQKQKGESDARLLAARNQQEALLTLAHSATNVLTRLLSDSDSLRSDAQALKTNDTGRAISLSPDLVLLSRRFFETELGKIPERGELVVALENARRIEQQLSANLGSAYEPSPDISTNLQGLISWGQAAEREVFEVRGALNALTRESKVKVAGVVSPETPKLDAAISVLNQSEADSRLKLNDQALSAAKASAELEALRAQKDKIMADAKREADTVRAQIQEEKDKWEREKKVKEAELKIEESKSQVLVQGKEAEAQRVILREKASDPTVLAKISPFTTPGYYQLNRTSTEKKPLSFSQLQTVGALSPDMKGLKTLLSIAWTSNDRVRPRWSMNPTLFQKSPAQLEKVKEAQALLIELGPVLVEKGLLEP